MTTLGYLRTVVLPAAYQLLPPAMNSPPATAMLLAIALQESEIADVMHRRQIVGKKNGRHVFGPAKSFWMFEMGGGTHGVLTHKASAPIIHRVLATVQVLPKAAPCHAALEHNDILAACFARCLLWTIPDPLPGPTRPDVGWGQYLRCWRPGKPHKATWAAHYDRAWSLQDEVKDTI